VSADLDDGERRELRRKTKAATLEAIETLGGEARRSAFATERLPTVRSRRVSSPRRRPRRPPRSSIASWITTWPGR
jgi:hypothetical protein